MLNKKGFTLVELMATIVIIALVASIAMISYESFIKQSTNRVYETYVDTIHAEMAMYLTDNSTQIPSNGTTKTFYLNDMTFTEIHNPDNTNDKCKNADQSKDSYIEVTRNDKDMLSLSYKVCLKCNSYSKCKEY